MAVAPFFFQILFGPRRDTRSAAPNQSIVVEVSPEAISRAPLSGQKEKAERDFAEKLAQQAATEIIQGQSASATETADSIAQIGALPKGIEEQSPALQRGGVRAWLV
jgi:flagellar basal body P-ring protein FlgI